MQQIQQQFNYIVSLIRDSRNRAYQAVNQELVSLYWQVGEYVSQQVAAKAWGDHTVQQLAEYIFEQDSTLKGFNKRGLYRMKQFYEMYSIINSFSSTTQAIITKLTKESNPSLQAEKFVSSLLTQITWTNHLSIMSGCSSMDERIFYIVLTIQEKYSSRELKRQIESSLYERTMLSSKSNRIINKHVNQNIEGLFRDTYILEFLGIEDKHSEKTLKSALVNKLKDFILELGRDFLFMGQEYRLQVSTHDYFIDLLFYNRNLNCMVAIELKTVEFHPSHLGQINFYLEALDRDVRKPHENPSIGILLCKGKDDTVVEYALSRSLSPTLVADYQTKLPNKKILQAKWEEILEEVEKNQED